MKLSFDELYQIVYTNHNDGGLTGASIVESSTRIAKALEAALAQQEPPCNNPLRSEITCADLVRDNDNLREALAQAKALYLEEIHTRTLAQQAQPERTYTLDEIRYAYESQASLMSIRQVQADIRHSGECVTDFLLRYHAALDKA